jgi:hypothetical protein
MLYLVSGIINLAATLQGFIALERMIKSVKNLRFDLPLLRGLLRKKKRSAIKEAN